jgi:hypothetical protein
VIVPEAAIGRLSPLHSRVEERMLSSWAYDHKEALTQPKKGGGE